ncbi:hypothetical protein [Pseudomonas phage PA1C]|uniref:Uncharacterized protein n=1 Tax=Pseudomonas phage vB_PaeM_PS119XW TaxID=2601632 RepID=A0A5C1K6Y2_9CAUD|nr:hypothetical protein PP933_gp118 [Pseudomonas phage vB_PaeM_PS119XW]QBX32273.1 hypothetical protein [Pseudomonas phage PA1C]QEM41847.1 hypothetical protein [Pseudomonas phage vB_PaeM_PS119XW]BEG72753.1 hypothetical protein RVBP21_3810 [Pseudomonas phage BRkr]
MFGNFVKGLGCVVVGGVISMIAITWTDENTAEEVMQKLRDANDRIPPDYDLDKRKEELSDLAERLIHEAEERILLTATLRELREEVVKFLRKL